MANALKTLFTDIADSIRGGLPDAGAMSPSAFPEKIDEIVASMGSGGGESTDLVKYVTFLSENGTQLYRMPVLTGDDCKDPVEHGDIAKPTKASTNTSNYTYSGWTSDVGGESDADILKNITEDKTVYVAFAASVRYYTVNFYDGDTLLETYQVTYGATAEYFPEKTGYFFNGWIPSNENITSDTDCYVQWGEGSPFAVHSWTQIAENGAKGIAQDIYSIGDEKDLTLYNASTGAEIGTVKVAIAGFNHDDLADGSGKAPISIVFKTMINTASWASSYVSGQEDSYYYTSNIAYGPNYQKNTFPSELQSLLKPVLKDRDTGRNYNGTITTEQNPQLIWYLSLTELGFPTGADSTGRTYSAELGKKYDLFPKLTSMDAATDPVTLTDGTATGYWTRNVYRQGNVVGNFSVSTITSEGKHSFKVSSHLVDKLGRRLGFCI